MKKLFAAAIVLCSIIDASALVTFPKAANNFQLYPDTALAEVKDPKGYEIFHVEHYGRHGSRWHIGLQRYDSIMAIMNEAEAIDNLTPLGREILKEVTAEREPMVLRDGELSEAGARQHRGIAARMAKNYPNVFRKGAYIDARSTFVRRCILSMSNAVTQLVNDVPGMNVHIDATMADDFYLKKDDNPETAQAMAEAWPKCLEFRATRSIGNDFLGRLFKDPSKIAPSRNIDYLSDALYEVAANAVSTRESSVIRQLFTDEEIDKLWQRQNCDWFMRAGNTPLTRNLMPMKQADLLANIINSADTAIVSPNISANLRYGHESIVLPLVVLMEINGFGKEYSDLDEVAREWRSCDVFPMACNVQIVFARPKGKKTTRPEDVLVKVMLNEQETSLPIPADKNNFSRWTDFRNHYLAKIKK